MFNKLAKFTEATLGFDAFCLNRKFLVFNLVNRNLKIKYRRSLLGFFWTILSPLALSLIYYFTFKVVMKIDRPHYLPFILCGVLPWSFFAQSLNESTESIVTNHGLISKIPVPIQVFPYVVSITNFSTLAISIPVIIILAWISGIVPSLVTLLIIPHFLFLLIISYSIGTILSVVYVYLRDLRHAISLILQVWFYATPIVYDISMIPEKYSFILYLNPVGYSFVGIQESILGNTTHSLTSLLIATTWSAICLFLLRIIYKKFRIGLPEVL